MCNSDINELSAIASPLVRMKYILLTTAVHGGYLNYRNNLFRHFTNTESLNLRTIGPKILEFT